MYAVIKTGGKQYRVSTGDVIEIERLSEESGSEVTFDEVLVVGTDEGFEIGRPTLEKFRVKGEIIDHIRDEKIVTFKHKRRKNYRRKIGHRQSLSKVLIKEIAGS